MFDSKRLMDICKEALPDTYDDYIPDLVYDFIWDYQNTLREILE